MKICDFYFARATVEGHIDSNLFIPAKTVDCIVKEATSKSSVSFIVSIVLTHALCLALGFNFLFVFLNR